MNQNTCISVSFTDYSAKGDNEQLLIERGFSLPRNPEEVRDWIEEHCMFLASIKETETGVRALWINPDAC